VTEPAAASGSLPAASAAAAKEFWLPGLLDEQQLAERLGAGELGAARLLHVHNATQLFGDFKDGGLKIDFEAKLDYASTYWWWVFLPLPRGCWASSQPLAASTLSAPRSSQPSAAAPDRPPALRASPCCAAAAARTTSAPGCRTARSSR
jgi:hypothetical protein